MELLAREWCISSKCTDIWIKIGKSLEQLTYKVQLQRRASSLASWSGQRGNFILRPEFRRRWWWCPYQIVKTVWQYIHSFWHLTVSALNRRADGGQTELVKNVVLCVHCMLTFHNYAKFICAVSNFDLFCSIDISSYFIWCLYELFNQSFKVYVHWFFFCVLILVYFVDQFSTFT